MLRMVPQRVLVGVLLVLLLPTMSPVAAATPVPSYYTLTELGTLPGATEAAARAINDRGQAIGYAVVDRTRSVPYLYDHGQIQDLSAFGLNAAYGINNSGQIAGGAMLLSNGATISLVPPQGGVTFSATALNDNAQIVGNSNLDHPGIGLWQQGTITTLLPGFNGIANAINNAGQIALTENLTFNQYGDVLRSAAYRYDLATGQLTDLQAQVGADEPLFKSGAGGINETGHVAGFAATFQRTFPVLWRDGQAIDLGGYGGANGINDADQVVGSSSIPNDPFGPRATLWRDGKHFDLNTLTPQGTDWHLTQAIAINNAGQIVGVGTRADQRLRAFLLTPRFHDLPPDHPYRDAILALADRGIIQGYGDGRVGADDPVLRAQSASLIARAAGWDTEDWPDTTFPDQGVVDDALWRNVRTLAHYRVALGYEDGTYNPIGEVLHQQVVLFIARAMVATGSWVEQADTSPYPNLPDATEREKADRRAVATFVHYAGAAPDGPTGEPWADWDQPATRGWFAQALWQALQIAPAPAGTRFGRAVLPQRHVQHYQVGGQVLTARQATGQDRTGVVLKDADAVDLAVARAVAEIADVHGLVLVPARALRRASVAAPWGSKSAPAAHRACG
jgi:probable HAF family extracellular repeat protein